MAPPLLNGMANTPGINWTLSKWLAVKTDDARDLLIAKINTYDPSLSHDNCRGLLTAHLEFQRLVDPLYGDPVLQQNCVKKPARCKRILSSCMPVIAPLLM